MTAEQTKWLKEQKALVDKLHTCTDTLTRLIYNYKFADEKSRSLVPKYKEEIAKIKAQIDPKYYEYLRVKEAQNRARVQMQMAKNQTESDERVRKAVEESKKNPFYHPKLTPAEYEKYLRITTPYLYKK